MFLEPHKLLMSWFFSRKTFCLRSSLTLTLSDVTSFLPDNLSGLRKIYIQVWCHSVNKSSYEEYPFLFYCLILVITFGLYDVKIHHLLTITDKGFTYCPSIKHEFYHPAKFSVFPRVFLISVERQWRGEGLVSTPIVKLVSHAWQ